MKKRIGNITTYIILLILIFITGIFYITSLTVKNNYIGKSELFSPLPINSPESSLNPTLTPKPSFLSDCKIEGCSGQLCVPKVSEPIITTCEYNPEYACLKYSICEKQASGLCGFTPTDDYLSCLNNLENPPTSF